MQLGKLDQKKVFAFLDNGINFSDLLTTFGCKLLLHSDFTTDPVDVKNC